MRVRLTSVTEQRDAMRRQTEEEGQTRDTVEAELRERAREAATHAAEVDGKGMALSAANATLERDVQRLRAQLEKSHTQAMRSVSISEHEGIVNKVQEEMAGVIQTLRLEVASAETSLQEHVRHKDRETEERVTALEQDHARQVTLLMERVTQLEGAGAQARTQTAAAEATNRDLRAMNTQLEQALAEQREKASEALNDALLQCQSHELDRARTAALAAAQGETDNKRLRYESITQHLSMAVEELQTKLRKAVRESAVLRQQTSTLSVKQQREARALSAEIRRWREHVAQLETQLKVADSRVNAAAARERQRGDALAHKLADAQARLALQGDTITTTKRANAVLRAERVTLSERLAGAVSVTDVTRGDVDRAKDEIVRLRAQLEQSEAKCRQSVDAAAQLSESLSTTEDSSKSLHSENANLRADLTRARGEITALENRVTGLKAESERFRAGAARDIREGGERETAVRRELHAAEMRLSAVTQKMGVLAEENTSVRARDSSVTALLSRSFATLESGVDTVFDRLSAEVSRLRSGVRDTGAEIERVSTTNVRARSQLREIVTLDKMLMAPPTEGKKGASNTPTTTSMYGSGGTTHLSSPSSSESSALETSGGVSAYTSAGTGGTSGASGTSGIGVSSYGTPSASSAGGYGTGSPYLYQSQVGKPSPLRRSHRE
ncbi:hypothetical protein KIPB_000797 [Kipferlia bialata]|uniref:Uncharacterized protein n=1 Tax=Kipferlia bialata TaxID=797122 RepID=A0A9K3CPS7_9EUKA|nr:hypothetical protein KIPB_000797 [Kipferlia bialata]|eukprot:g797.t1